MRELRRRTLNLAQDVVYVEKEILRDSGNLLFYVK